MAGRAYGRIRPEIPPHLDDSIMHFGAALPVKLRTAPPAVAWWKPLIPRILGGNDKWGSCGPTSYANMIKVSSAYTMAAPVILSTSEVLGIYQQVNPEFNPITGTGDNGVNLNQLYELMKVAGPRGVNLTQNFAVVPTSVNNIKWAIRIFGPVTFGVNLTAADESASEAGQPWSLPIGRQGPIVGGHAVTVYDYDDIAGVWKAESWADPQDIEYEWQLARCDEVHGFIHPYQFVPGSTLGFTGMREQDMLTDAGLI